METMDQLSTISRDLWTDFRGVAGKVPLENALPAKELKIGVLTPSLYNRFITEAVKLLQNQQNPIKWIGFVWPPCVVVKLFKMMFQIFPRNMPCQFA